jgi:hypothetical protein
MRVSAAAAAILMLCGTAAAQEPDFTCGSNGKLLDDAYWGLLEARDTNGASFGFYARVVRDDAKYALMRTKADGWPSDYLVNLEALLELASGIAERDGKLEPGETDHILAAADGVARHALGRCAIPTPDFVRPGEADARACHELIRALEDFEKRLPVITGENIAYRPMMRAVGKTSEWALREATRSHWSAASLATLARLAEVGPRYATGEIVADAESGAALLARMQAVAAEAYPICGTLDIPLYVGAK